MFCLFLASKKPRLQIKEDNVDIEHSLVPSPTHFALTNPNQSNSMITNVQDDENT